MLCRSEYTYSISLKVNTWFIHIKLDAKGSLKSLFEINTLYTYTDILDMQIEFGTQILYVVYYFPKSKKKYMLKCEIEFGIVHAYKHDCARWVFVSLRS